MAGGIAALAQQWPRGAAGPSRNYRYNDNQNVCRLKLHYAIINEEKRLVSNNLI